MTAAMTTTTTTTLVALTLMALLITPAPTKAALAVQSNEAECIIQGGICVPKDDCAPDYLSSVKGLCPKQQAMGVECCYDLPMSVTSCEARGGFCMPKDGCHIAPVKGAICSDTDHTCCPLVAK